MKHILKHAGTLSKLAITNEAKRDILVIAADDLNRLVESDMPKGLMEQRFYELHDAMMEDILHSLDEEDLMQLEAHAPPQVKFETWARKHLQERFKIPDPMEYAFSTQDVPA